MENKEQVKQLKIEEKKKLRMMSKDERRTYLLNKKNDKKALALEAFKKWECTEPQKLD